MVLSWGNKMWPAEIRTTFRNHGCGFGQVRLLPSQVTKQILCWLPPPPRGHSCPSQWHERAPMVWRPVTGPGFCVHLAGRLRTALLWALLYRKGVTYFSRRSTVRTRDSAEPRAKSLLLLLLVRNLDRGCCVGRALSHSSWSLGASSGRAM